ncbi:6,7-dimethyl-8-ribityllumazine synthase [Loigolactobacillus backii]|uniref:6,7-dimethyl-8-ribityllumazine synthase n=1 Tax=Loigolactobacillus backii TaxID=375175 RepID=A0A192H0N1_9LACO|nr:6,7-dimethyl-8-ribityllumazine synthase [Loigolactobacillus backii]ANK60632.1 6,7-dimethyl-8-ribityllumazine synthase [Loigolactobacillus backii]ANK61802.1 6,7-dimethyl-8-ribityllumazine synthase [Loigolactobacillus backii]ANK65585.1 6,7-dimethyl-8-ribityllumazine synthase [Loigolactobacillus backii]ANK68056.1 6,7-dimethyl-8-ribityllumazine synthase [Loigolactobacillus backii]ANK69004.1 6,7-dimethyl-8-ribityllumazine synthase [Loigolactobacillus backii]
MTIYSGNLTSKDVKIAIVVARFNEFVTSKLLGGALDVLGRHEVAATDIDTIWVPGAFEIPAIAKLLDASGKYDGIITLGAVIRGETSHYDYVCNEVSKGIGSLALNGKTPIVFGVLTTENVEQAIQRSGAKSGNKGSDVATSILEIINLKRQLVTATK